MRGIRPGNKGEQSQSPIEVIQSLTKVGGMQYNVVWVLNECNTMLMIVQC